MFRGGMMRGITHGGWLTLVVLLIAAAPGFSQAQQQKETFIVAGHTGKAPVTRVDGRSYVAIDALARLLNGSLRYQGDEITLTLPAGASVGGAPPSQPLRRAFSRDFLNSGIETISDIREWRSALLVAVQNGYNVTEGWMGNYQAQAAKNLRLASVAATTDADRNALPLLNGLFGHMQQLEKKVVAGRKTRRYISTETLQKDPLDQKILSCAHSLGEMATSGEFQDNGSCR
jgi:hypothetical protein